MHVYICVHMYIYIYICIHVCAYIHYVYICIYTCVYMYIYKYIYIYMCVWVTPAGNPLDPLELRPASRLQPPQRPATAPASSQAAPPKLSGVWVVGPWPALEC